MELAEAYQKAASIQWMQAASSLGDRSGAAASSQKGIAIREGLLARSPSNSDNTLKLANAYGYLSLLHDRSNPALADTYDKRRSALVADLLQRFPENRDVLFAAANQHGRRGLSLHSAGQLDEALAAQRTAMELCERITRRYPDDFAVLRFQGWYQVYAGDVLGGAGSETHLNDRAGALLETGKGLAILQRIAQKNPANSIAQRDVATVTMRVAGIYEATGRGDEAIALRKSIARQLEALLEADPKSMESARDAAISHSGLGNALSKAKRVVEAEPELRRAQAINLERIERFPQDLQAPLDLAAVNQYLGDLYERTGRLQEAIEVWQQALPLRESGLKADPRNGPLLWRQGMTYYST